MTRALAALFALTWAASTRADDADVHALPCRPTIACTADLVPPGATEVEVGYIYRRLAGATDESALPFLVKVTLAEWIQLQIGSNGPTVVSASSGEHFLDDVTIGTKLHVLDQRRLAPSVSLSATISIPTFEANGYLRTWDALFTIYATKDIGWLHADLNLGANAWRIEGAPLAQGWAALALSVPVHADVGAMLEGYAFSDAAPVSPRDAGILAAASWAPRPWLVFDAGPDVGLVHATRVVSAFVGVTVAR